MDTGLSDRLPDLSPEARRVLRAHVDARIEDCKNRLCALSCKEEATREIRIEVKMLRWLGALCDDPEALTPPDEGY